MAGKKPWQPIYGCLVKYPTKRKLLASARTACQVNPLNRPLVHPGMGVLPPEHLALLTSKYWGQGGVDLTVSFLDRISASLAAKLLESLNQWSAFCNVKFRQTSRNGQVRISFDNSGYWSYLGTDILHIPQGQPTMNLQGFNRAGIPQSEYDRVPPHEAGHTLGFPHEHERQEIIDLLDEAKTLAYYEQWQGWSEEEVRAQVLTPPDPRDLRGTDRADVRSIMCYPFPGQITRSGQPIPGGDRINDLDRSFAASIYPLPGQPTKPGPDEPGGPDEPAEIRIIGKSGKQTAAFKLTRI